MTRSRPKQKIPKSCGTLCAGQYTDDYYDDNGWWIKSNDFLYKSVRFNHPMMYGATTYQWGWMICASTLRSHTFPLYYNAGTEYVMTDIAGYVDIRIIGNRTFDDKFSGTTEMKINIRLNNDYAVKNPKDTKINLYISTSPDVGVGVSDPSEYTVQIPFYPNPSEPTETQSYTLRADTDLFYTDMSSGRPIKRLLGGSQYTTIPKIIIHIGDICKL